MLDIPATDDIDVYIPFVDGNDRMYARQLRDCAMEMGEDYDERTTGLRRINDFGQLRMAVRSVHFCLPWIRYLHLIFHTDRHIPTWLNRDHPKIKIHLHRDYFDSGIELPCFSSFVIDTQIGRVPELAERFIYMEDDQFFCRRQAPSDFFNRAGQPIYDFTSYPHGMTGWKDMARYKTEHGLIWPHAYKFGNQIWKHYLGIDDDVQLLHVEAHRPFPFPRSIFERTNVTFPDLYQHSIAQRFRRSDVLSLDCYIWGLAWNGLLEQKLGWKARYSTVPGRIPSFYKYWWHDSGCINDLSKFKNESERQSGTKSITKSIMKFMNRMFRYPSPFELTS